MRLTTLLITAIAIVITALALLHQEEFGNESNSK